MKLTAENKPKTLDPKQARGWRYYSRRIAIDLLIGYALVCLGVFLLQKKMVYQPATETALSLQDYGFAPAQAREIETQTSDGVRLKGWELRGPRKPGQNEPGLSQAAFVEIFFCGNAGNRGDRSGLFRRLTSLGADVVCFDYRGYGDSEGSPFEEGLAKDARAAWEWVRAQGVPAKDIVLHGESLGGGVAVRLASELCAEKTPPAGLVLEATFPRLRDVAGLHHPYLPVRLILTQRFPSIERIPQVSCPLLALHGARDELIPLALGRELFAAAPETSATGLGKEFVELPDCGHNDLGTLDAEQYRAALSGFYQKLFPDKLKPADTEPKARPARNDKPPRQRREHRPAAPQ